MYKEKHSRSIIKTLSWRITATVTTISLVWIFTRQLAAAFVVGGIEVFLKMFLYYIHERSWNKVSFGRVEVAPFVLWFTGLPGSGKSTIANAVYEELKKENRKMERLDGESVRQLFPRTGFSRKDRIQHIERVGHLSSILVKNNITVVASFISPYRESRQFVRRLSTNFIEIFLNTPLEVCEQRDPKGLYAKARKGEIKQFTGVDDPYEKPENPNLVIDTVNKTVEENVKLIITHLKEKDLI